MDEADRLCHRIAVMDQGKILVNDTPAELKKMIPGGNSLELRVQANGGVRQSLLSRLQALPGVAKVEETLSAEGLLDDVAYRIYAPGSAALVGPAAQAAMESGALIRDLSVKSATLEEVFIYLTGRHLR